MQRKISNIKYKLHSIPITLLNMKNKSNVLYSIPCSCVLALLLVGVVNLAFGKNYCAALDAGDGGEAITDAGTIAPVSGGSSTPATASMSLSNPNMTSSAITPGNTTTVSTNVSVKVDNAESYSLILKVDNTTLKNGNTTINAGNVVDDNTWGYKWDTETSYTAPSTSGKNLTVPALTNNSVDFTKTLTFGAKFATSAEAGHYRGSGTLSLVATPKATTYTLADLTQMQQLADGYAPDACKNTTIPAGQDYAGPYTLTDVRDNNTYTVYKFKDGKCWMTDNLRLSNHNVGTMGYSGGRLLIPTTSDVSSNWTLPVPSTSGFSDNTASNAYVSGNTGYYTWCAATAGSCSSVTTDGAEAPSSICPKGWKLPTGGVGGQYDTLTIAEDITNSASGSSKIQGVPYNFVYTGDIYDGVFHDPAVSDDYSYGIWWARTSKLSTIAYRFTVGPGYIFPSTFTNYYYHGYAVRCIAAS